MKLKGAILASGLCTMILNGCGGVQSGTVTPVTGSQGRMHQASGSSGTFAYVSMTDETYILTYPGLSKIGKINGGSGTDVSSDPNNGNMLLSNDEYAHGATKPFARLSLPSGEGIYSSAFDPTTDNMAFVIYKTFSGAWVGVYSDLYGTPTNYYDSQMQTLGFLAYDGNGNLFVQAFDSSGQLFIAELPKGSNTFTNYPVDKTLSFPGVMRWDGQYLVIRTHNTLNRLAVSDSGVTVVSKTQLTGAYGRWSLGYWIQDGFAIGPHLGPHRHNGEYLGVWKYPDGGKPSKVLKDLAKNQKDRVYGVTVSVAPTASHK